jgi:N utilization substance protein B
LDILYRLEIDDCQTEEAADDYMDEAEEKGIRDFIMRVVDGIKTNEPEIDAVIVKYADKWSLSRMPVLDRNILRIAVFEMLNEEDIPISVTINEAVEMANTYSTDDSGRFVNGLLGNAAKHMKGLKIDAKEKD